jgi:2-dehydropantoate 2-reductase
VRFVVYGAGAVGGTIGARLFQAGHDVALIARGEHLAAIRREGLLFETPDTSERLRIPAAGAPGELAPGADDVVLLAMKTQHSEAAMDELRAAAREEPTVVCAQNGVENERMAARRFARVHGMLVFLPSNHTEPGVVQAQSRKLSGILDVGLWPRGCDAADAAIAAALSGAGFGSRPDADVMRWKRAKLLTNLGNALQACCPPTRDAADLLARARDEAIACFRAAGLGWASDEEFAGRRGDSIQPAPIRGRMRGGGSTWQSLARGAGSIESDYLNGEIVLLGREHGVPTPVNRALQEAASRLARERARPESLPLETLRRRVAELERAPA